MPDNADEVIASALSLSEEGRFAVLNAVQGSLLDPDLDHGPNEPADEVATAWRGEIGRRMDEVRSGEIKTVAAEDAERMIRGDAKPEI